MKDAKYLAAYLLPLSAAAALYWQGGWAWATVLLAFVIIPVVEIFTPESTENVTPEQESVRTGIGFFDWLLYLNIPMVFGLVFWYLKVISNSALTIPEIMGLTLGTGIILGANGINVAHELGHRSRRSEQFLSKLLLLPTLYQHFFIEHNRGHHKNVATDKDSASAQFGQVVYIFWLRSVWGSWRSAWTLERERLTKEGKPFWSWHNEMIRFTLFQVLWLGAIAWYFGTTGLLGALAIATMGILLLETINYVEHYGLRRRLLESGRPEPVRPEHSWNSNHELGRIFLYELTRHSDHHFKATRKYQILRHMNESPQLPFGYPTSIIIALLPPLWFAVMHPRLRKTAAAVGI
ncbi:MAG TPA: alkane 1-monooxygenase [Saprospiraceae bacterium]|nr:alkane 1-monooxygenase [Saprospiraceae bacterium]